MKAKKILAFLISAVMAVQSAPMQVLAEEKPILGEHFIADIADIQ